MSSRPKSIRRATVNQYLVREAGSTDCGAQERAIRTISRTTSNIRARTGSRRMDMGTDLILGTSSTRGNIHISGSTRTTALWAQQCRYTMGSHTRLLITKPTWLHRWILRETRKIIYHDALDQPSVEDRHLVEESSGFAEFPEFFERPKSYLPTEVDEVRLRKNSRIDLQSQNMVG